jgi:hypothetical protein
MRKLIGILAIAGGAALSAPTAASAQTYPWCAQYGGGMEGSGATNCGFSTWRQCMETVAGGRIGDCFENPRYSGAALPQGPHRKRHPRPYPG